MIHIVLATKSRLYMNFSLFSQSVFNLHVIRITVRNLILSVTLITDNQQSTMDQNFQFSASTTCRTRRSLVCQNSTLMLPQIGHKTIQNIHSSTDHLQQILVSLRYFSPLTIYLKLDFDSHFLMDAPYRLELNKKLEQSLATN